MGERPMDHDPNQVNAWDDGRGVYFDDPDGRRLEIIKPISALT